VSGTVQLEKVVVIREPRHEVPKLQVEWSSRWQEFLGAIKPQVVVVNNGPRKGMGQVDNGVKSITPAGTQAAPYEKVAYLRLAKIPGIEGIWQEHLSLLDPDPGHNTSQEMIANLDENEDKGNWIKASVQPDGKFTVTNGRNGFSKTYIPR